MAWHVRMHLLQAQLKVLGVPNENKEEGKTQSLCKLLGISLGYRFDCCLLVDSWGGEYG